VKSNFDEERHTFKVIFVLEQVWVNIKVLSAEENGQDLKQTNLKQTNFLAGASGHQP